MRPSSRCWTTWRANRGSERRRCGRPEPRRLPRAACGCCGQPEAAPRPDGSKPIGTHFLNFATGRPVWELKDGSSVEAARKAAEPAGPGNIPSLLLQAVATSAGRDGDHLTATTWVQRLNTSGGVAPAGTCTTGDRAVVPYAADYFFWRASS